MGMDGKIYITISEGAPAGQGGGGNGSGSSDSESKKSSKFDKYIAHETLHFIRSETRKIINYAITNTGARTGDYIAQANMNAAFNMANRGLNIGMAAYSGLRYGPVGAAIGAGAATVLNATDLVLQAITLIRQTRIQNTNIEMIRQRAGLDTYTDGSRGTEN